MSEFLVEVGPAAAPERVAKRLRTGECAGLKLERLADDDRGRRLQADLKAVRVAVHGAADARTVEAHLPERGNGPGLAGETHRP